MLMSQIFQAGDLVLEEEDPGIGTEAQREYGAVDQLVSDIDNQKKWSKMVYQDVDSSMEGTIKMKVGATNTR